MRLEQAVSLAEAAHHSVGDARSKGKLAKDLFVCVAAPLIFPALCLALFRLRDTPDISGTVSLTDAAFAFSALAIAIAVRQAALGRWSPLFWCTAVVVVIEFVIGMATDMYPSFEQLISTITHWLHPSGELAPLQQAALNKALLAESINTHIDHIFLYWIIVAGAGIVMMLLGILYVVLVRDDSHA